MLEMPTSSRYRLLRESVVSRMIALSVDSFSILFNHGSFQKPDPFSLGFWRFSRKIPGKNGEGTPRIVACADPSQ